MAPTALPQPQTNVQETEPDNMSTPKTTTPPNSQTQDATSEPISTHAISTAIPPSNPTPQWRATPFSKPPAFPTAASIITYPSSSPSPMHSNYPRASPPIFLYPTPIVPAQAKTQSLSEPGGRGGDGKAAFLLRSDGTSAFDTWLAVFVAVALVAAFAWGAVVYFVNFPPVRRSSPSRSKKLVKKNTEGDGTSRFKRMVTGMKGIFGYKKGNDEGYELLNLQKGKAGKPIDKPPKFANLASAEGKDESGDVENSPLLRHLVRTSNNTSSDTPTTAPLLRHLVRTSNSNSSSTPSTGSSSAYSAGSYKQQYHTRRRRHFHSRTISTPIAPVATANSPRYLSPPPTLHSRSLSSTSSPRSLPTASENPFFPSRSNLRIRSSAEWMRERERFHAGQTSPSYTPVSPSALAYARVGDIEAQNTHSESSLSGSLFSPRTLSGSSSEDKENAYVNPIGKAYPKGHRKRGSWLDAVDGAVTKAVGKVVRWTEDKDGDEGLLLPVAEK